MESEKAHSSKNYKSNQMKRALLLLLVAVQFVTAQENYLAIPDSITAKDRICFALYTVHKNTLKLTAQFYPIKNYEPFEASLEIKDKGEWKEIAKTEIIYPGYTAPFRVENWDDSQQVRYRVAHNNTAFYEGIIQKNPIDKQEFTMVAFTGNSIYPQHGGDISREDIVDNVKKLKPDLLFFSGDQVYDHSEHYLSWLKFGRDFGEIISNTPTICLPDDHDVGQANLWGANGKKAKARRGISGGYYMPVSYVKEVERAQTSHLPDPYDPTPIEQGIGVYYTALTRGGISFAILEDRKFKSGLEGMVSYKGEVVEALTDATIDTKQFDVPGATLLGKRQLQFLEDWTTDWEEAQMKSVLSQTIFAMGNNYSGKQDNELFADFDTNGWPQTGRNKALSVIRKSFSCMVAGDQHLGTVMKHGVSDWDDSGYSFCVPSIANLWLRWWQPTTPGKNRKKNSPDYTGEFLDGFQNKITEHAVANPTLSERQQEGGKLSTRAAGFGIVKYNKPNRTITFECWGRNTDIFDGASRQYPGWPITISQEENYSPKGVWQLPELEISEPNQVVTVRDANSNEVFSSIRVKGNTYQPFGLPSETYSIEIGQGEQKKVLPQLTTKKRNRNRIEVKL